MLYVYTDADGTHEELMTGEELVARNDAIYSKGARSTRPVNSATL
jgi:hypothetical protein